MNTTLLATLAFLIIFLNSCGQTTQKQPETTAVKTTGEKVALPPHTYTYKSSSKTKSTGTKTNPAIKTGTQSLAPKTSLSSGKSSSSGTLQTSGSTTGAIGKTVTKTTTTTSSPGAVTPPSGSSSQTPGGKPNTTTSGSSSGSGSSSTTGSPTSKGDKMGNPGGSTTTTNTGGSQSTGDILGKVLGGGTGSFTEADAANAIKEALMKGVAAGVSKVSVTDGYFKNSMIKIPFPEDAKIVETTLRQVGMGSMIDNLVLSLNRAAESAANQAGPIFVNGIKQMTITDAINIVGNQQPDAATKFLQRTTTEGLVLAFKPPIKSALDKTLATKYWADIMTYYNKVPFVKKVNPDLNDFVTRKAISGLFYMIGQEEAKIRKDPMGQGSAILEKVFGGVLKR